MVAMHSPTPPAEGPPAGGYKELRANALVLEDAQGRVRIVAAAHTDRGMALLYLQDAAGNAQLSAGVDQGGNCHLFLKAGTGGLGGIQASVQAGCPMLSLVDREGRHHAGIWIDEAGRMQMFPCRTPWYVRARTWLRWTFADWIALVRRRLGELAHRPAAPGPGAHTKAGG